MAFDEAGDEERPRPDPPLPPEDRLWRHPSEVAGGTPLPSAWPAPTPPAPSRGSRAVAALAAAGVAGAVVAVGVMWITRPTKVVVEDSPRQAARSTPTALYAAGAVPSEVLAKRLAPSLVQVEASRDGSWIAGTGFRVDAEGTVAVATPIVAGASTVMVTGHDGKRVRAAVGGQDSATGITVLTVSSHAGGAVDADAVDATAGEPVAVFAAASVSPEGDAVPRVVPASISAVGMRSTVDPIVLHDAVQLDRSIPADAMGGLVVDAEGDLVGVVLDPSGSEDLAVVVPAADALSAAQALRDDGTVRRAWLGVRAIDLSPAAADLMAVDGGAQLTMVQAGSPAASAGLHKGDVITSVDGHPIGDASDLVVELRRWQPGEQIVVVWRRGRDTGKAEVTLGG